MDFKLGQVIALPELAQSIGLTSDAFTVERVIKGGMGECVRVSQGDNAYALKLLRSDALDNPESWNRYLREARIWATLSGCDGVLDVLCITRMNELPIICSPWMAGGNLRPYLADRSPAFFFSVISRMVGTLAWAHQTHNVIHRDLKPDNILLDATRQAFVSDWGLARPLSDNGAQEGVRSLSISRPIDLHLTATGSFVGTITYSSPEQILGDTAIDYRADIYSLGCLMYEWETGHGPFTGETAQEIALKHLLEEPPPLAGFLRRTSLGVEKVILACLEKDPRNRPSNYESLDLALSDAAKKRGERYERFVPNQRRDVAPVGAQTYKEQIKTNSSGYGIVEHAEIEKFLVEGSALIALGEYAKALEIYSSLFVPEMVLAVPDYSHNQLVAINYALCLTALGRPGEAVNVLSCLSAAEDKPLELFVNLSLAQIKCGEYRSAATAARAGLELYPENGDLLGNLLVAQTQMGEVAEAAKTATIRLTKDRSVHSLQEVAALHIKYSDGVRETDWPVCVKHLEYAIELLREAKDLNPRYLQARLSLPIALEKLTAYGRCTEELVALQDFPMHASDRAFLAYLFARCLDRVNDHRGCWEFCDKWLKRIAEIQPPLPRRASIMIERVRAVTIADGFCIGRTKDDQRMMSPVAAKFFAHIVNDEELRQQEDFCYLARLHEWMEEYEDANSALSRAHALYPLYWEIPYQRAAFLERAGNYSAALGSAQCATQLAPWKTQTWSQLASITGKLGLKDEKHRATARAEEVKRVRDQLNHEIED